MPVLPFVGGNPQDDELIHLVKYVEEGLSSDMEDVRIRNREAFNLRGMIDHAKQFLSIKDTSNIS